MAPRESWRSLHVYRYAGQDDLLVDCVAPLVADLEADGAVSGFFFLRYWQGGHHLRLRLRVAEDDADAVVGRARARLAGHLAANPVEDAFDTAEFAREAQPMMAAMEGADALELQPPDSVREFDYVPEHAKYGGPAGVAVAERYFGRSSAVALEALRGAGGLSRKRLGAGFSTMLRGLCAAGMAPQDMAAFFAHYCVIWSPYVFDSFMGTWPDLLRERRAAVGAHADALLTRRDALAGDPAHDAVAEAWAAVRGDDRVTEGVVLAGEDAPRERREQVLLVSYLHTHNNRLGLTPEQESFLGYLGHHVLSTWAGTEPAADLTGEADRFRRRRLREFATTSGGQR